MNSDDTINPYSPPTIERETATVGAKKPWAKVFFAVSLGLVSGLIGGFTVSIPGGLLDSFHPMMVPGVVFGVVSMVAVIFLAPRRRALLVLLIPVVSGIAFEIAGRLMDHTSLNAGRSPSVGGYAIGLLAASFAGNLLLGAVFWITGCLSPGGAARFSVMATFLGAACVVIVNAAAIGTVQSRLFLTMLIWQFGMMMFLIGLSQTSHRSRGTS